MEQRRIRLGDVIDDYCSRCRLIMNHGVVGMVADEVKKVRCNTCMSEHQYRHGRLPKRRASETGRLIEEVLKSRRGPVAPEAAEVEAEEPDSAEPEAPPEPEPQESQPEPPRPAHRRLYTIHRAMGKKPRHGPG